MKAKSLLLGTLALCIGMGLFTACDNQPKNEQPKAPETPAVPETPAEQELVYIDGFSTTDPHLTVTVSEDFTTATICRDGKEFQTVTEEFGLASDEPTVRFLDANFDGHTDIYIGPGASRTANSLLLWSEKEQKFVSVHNGTALQNPMLDPESKSFFDGGSNSFCELGIGRSTFDGDNMVMQEELTIITSPEEYANNNVEHKYTLKDNNDKVLCSTETVDGLPELWQKAVNAYGY